MEIVYIVMPAYNESDNIQKIVMEWYPIIEKIGDKSKLLIVDDSSTDNTFQILQDLQKQYKNLEIITKSNSGHGITCLYAYNIAILNGADWIFQTDSDGQTDPNEFWQFWKLREEYDFLIGLRNNREDGISRILVTKILRIILLLIFKENIPDANTPFRLIRAEVLKKYLKIIPKDSFLANVIMSTLIVKDKLRFIWIPINFKTRQGGVNSINFKKIIKIGIKALKDFRMIKKNI